MLSFYELYNIIDERSNSCLLLEINNKLAKELKSWYDDHDERNNSCLLLEISHKLAKELKSWYNDHADELPFSDLFSGNVIRRVIPFNIDPVALYILEKFEKVGGILDFNNGKVSINGKVFRIGKYLLGRNSPFSLEEKEWWNHRGNAISDLEVTKFNHEYVIVISRYPIDIVRMSDHDGLSSCHSPGEKYFDCAIADAKGSGAVAYIVKREDLSKVNLQDDEIFADKERNVSGIKPYSRLRLRKFVHKKGGFDLAIPEDRTYGKKFPGFIETMRNWSLSEQLSKLKGYGSIDDWKSGERERPRMKDFKLMGGSYQDTQGSNLFNNFFDDNLDRGDVEYGGEDNEYQNMADQMAEEVNQIKYSYENAFTICFFDVSVEDADDQPYVSYGGTVHLDIPEELMIPQNKVDNIYVRKAVKKWANDNGIYCINDVEVNRNEVIISIYDEINNGPDGFREFLASTLTDIENDKDKLKNSLYDLFIELGLARENKVKFINNNWDDHPHQFNNFKWEGEDPDIMITLTHPIELPVATKTDGGFQHEYEYWQLQFSNTLMKELSVIADRVHMQNQRQLNLFSDPEFQPKVVRPFKSEFKITPIIKIKPGTMMGKIGTDKNVFMVMAIEFEALSRDEDVEDVIEFVTFLDRNFDKFVKTVISVYNKVWVANWGKSQITP